MRIHLFFVLPILGLTLPALANQPLQAWLDTALPGTTLRLRVTAIAYQPEAAGDFHR